MEVLYPTFIWEELTAAGSDIWSGVSGQHVACLHSATSGPLAVVPGSHLILHLPWWCKTEFQCSYFEKNMLPGIKSGVCFPNTKVSCCLSKCARCSNVTIRLSQVCENRGGGSLWRRTWLTDRSVPTLIHAADHMEATSTAQSQMEWEGDRWMESKSGNTVTHVILQGVRDDRHLTLQYLSYVAPVLAWKKFFCLVFFPFFDYVVTDLTVNLIFINMLSYQNC